jgi:hypothetical protein
VALHLYGVTAAPAELPDGLTGRGDEPVRVVADGALAVLVSDVDPEAAAGARDLLAHGRVLETLAATVTVVPMQFGMVLPDEEAVRTQVLGDQRADLLLLMGSLDGHVQLSVQAFLHEQPALQEVLRREPGLREQRDALRGRGGVAVHAHQVELGRGVAEVLEYLQEEYHDLVVERLAPLSVAVADHEARAEQQVVNAAFLVRRDRRAEFDDEVAAVGAELEEQLRLRYVGPQPAYSFVGPVLSGELAWD